MKKVFTAFSSLLLIMLLLSSVLADDAKITATFDGTGKGAARQYTHKDKDPFKGRIDVEVVNTGAEPWGGIYYEIVNVGWDVSTVDFVVTAPYEPISVQNLSNHTVNDNKSGAVMFMDFHKDPVMPGSTATFTLYTDNTISRNWFAIRIYPTPMPPSTIRSFVSVGGTVLLLGLGAVFVRRNHKVKMEKFLTRKSLCFLL